LCQNPHFVTKFGGAAVQHVRIIALDMGTMLMQLRSQWLYGAQNRGGRNFKSHIIIFAEQFLRPVKVAAMARAMPAIP